MKDDLKWLAKWWLNGGPTDILAFWVTVGLFLIYIKNEAHRIPVWIIAAWTIAVAGWVYYRMFSTLPGKKDEEENKD